MCKTKSYRGGVLAAAARLAVAGVAPLACSLAVSLAAAGRTHAATLIANSRTGIVLNTIPAAGTAAKLGSYNLQTATKDTNGVPQTVGQGPRTVKYPANNVKDFVGGPGATGLIFSTAAGASIKYTAATGTFDSTGSYATVTRIANNLLNEYAEALATPSDPNSYTVSNWSAGSQVDLQISFGQGPGLLASPGGAGTSSSSLGVNIETNLVSGSSGVPDYINLLWSATSSTPNSSSFSATSDFLTVSQISSIESQFASDLTDIAGQHSLTNNLIFNIGVTPNIGLVTGSTLNFNLNDSVNYTADAAATPEPATLAIMGLAAGALLLVRRKRGGGETLLH